MRHNSISRVGIVGAGVIGPRIAYRCLKYGIYVNLHDVSVEALARADNFIKELLHADVAKGQMSGTENQTLQTRLHLCRELEECLAGVQFVIESIPENLSLKREVFGQIDRLSSPEVLLATNSSSLPCSRLSNVTKRPEKIINLNFSDPSENSLVEVMKGAKTSDETLQSVLSFLKSLEMVPIVTRKEIMGFSFNRIWRSTKREALHLVDGGYIGHEDIDRAWMLNYGTSIGPFGLMDIVGIDVVRDIEMQYYRESGRACDKPPKLLDNLISKGKLGMKSGQGFYSYPDPDYENPDWLLKKKEWEKD